MEEKEIYEKLRAILAEVLEIEAGDILEDSSLFNDLGIESIDLLDLTFTIEDEFGIEIPPGELWNMGVDFLDADRYLVEGILTAEGVSDLKRRFPLVDISSLGDRIQVMDVLVLITVRMVAHYISTKLGEARG